MKRAGEGEFHGSGGQDHRANTTVPLVLTMAANMAAASMTMQGLLLFISTNAATVHCTVCSKICVTHSASTAALSLLFRAEAVLLLA